MRADAERNRARVLAAAMTAFATGGLSVSVAEIARRAGVGTGTVSRHFPTKESLYEAIVLLRVGEIVDQARWLAATKDPGTAFFAFFAHMVDQAAANRGLAEALAGDGFDVEAAAARTGLDLDGVERELLDHARRAGAVRPDLTWADVKALIVGCLAREGAFTDAEARRRMIEIACAGLAAPPGHDPSRGMITGG
ncbi:TetR family transcriptional regulator [Sphaerisporangium rufum]|uniref:TetR family transcriptional regulator n=1 Tax=Sphaerisporangium rufum TaxID=1381558 RepID=A0A919V4E4_9ACTN|nr:TetR/AcrR family transcriptional regulator [Sphaerisporangium rufum]GII77175.1 TetR family transcriptional regulator [Sphaerisporangium rufum]